MSELTPSEASAEAAHKAKSAQMAVEISREVHLEEAIAKTAESTKAALLEGLQEVFGKGDDVGSGEMNILVRRIPLICGEIKQIHTDIGTTAKAVEKINANIGRVVWVVIMAVLAALLKLVLIS